MKCKDCGLILDSFGICPQASPQQVRSGRAPVFCGRRLDEYSQMIISLVVEVVEQPKVQ